MPLGSGVEHSSSGKSARVTGGDSADLYPGRCFVTRTVPKKGQQQVPVTTQAKITALQWGDVALSHTGTDAPQKERSGDTRGATPTPARETVF